MLAFGFISNLFLVYNLINNINYTETQNNIEEYRRSAAIQDNSMFNDKKRKNVNVPSLQKRLRKETKLEFLFSNLPPALSKPTESTFNNISEKELKERQMLAAGYSQEFMENRMLQEAKQLVFCI